MSCTRRSSMRTRSQRAYLAQKAKNCNKRKEKVQLHKKKNKYTHICALSKAPQLSAVITFRLARSTAFFNSSHILFTFRISVSNHFLQQIFIFIIYCSFTVAGYLFALLLCLAYRNHLIYCNFLSSTTTTMLWIISSHNSTHSQQFYNALSSYVNSHAFNVSITVRRYLFQFIYIALHINHSAVSSLYGVSSHNRLQVGTISLSFCISKAQTSINRIYCFTFVRVSCFFFFFAQLFLLLIVSQISALLSLACIP